MKSLTDNVVYQKTIKSCMFLHITIIIFSSFAEYSWAADYQYDNLNRLTQVDYGNGSVIQYSYDAVGNRTHIVTSESGYEDQESVNATGTYSFNESGDGHQVDMNFTSLTGNGDVTVQQTNQSPSNSPCSNVCGFNLNITKDGTITDFSVDVTFHYTDADISSYIETSAFLGIAKFNISTNSWTWLGGAVNAGSNTVTVYSVTSFSTFALFRRIFCDVTGDGYVDAADLQRFGDCWHDTSAGEFADSTDARFFNYNKNTDGGDQIIDAADLQVFGDCWHSGVEP